MKMVVGGSVSLQNEKDNLRCSFTQPLKKQNVCHLSEVMTLCKTEQFLVFCVCPDGESYVEF